VPTTFSLRRSSSSAGRRPQALRTDVGAVVHADEAELIDRGVGARAVRPRTRPPSVTVRSPSSFVSAWNTLPFVTTAASSASPPDVALCDLGLPGGDGWGMLRDLRRLHPRVGVVLMSGGDVCGPAPAAAGAAGVLAKPFGAADVLAAGAARSPV
jgi:CheY-like chemotaxis protein